MAPCTLKRCSSRGNTTPQFPEAIENLEPVTQLYVSVDAATKESLRAIDRPLFKDFWTRFLREYFTALELELGFLHTGVFFFCCSLFSDIQVPLKC